MIDLLLLFLIIILVIIIFVISIYVFEIKKIRSVIKLEGECLCKLRSLSNKNKNVICLHSRRKIILLLVYKTYFKLV